jgi:hypothetical protein
MPYHEVAGFREENRDFVRAGKSWPALAVIFIDLIQATICADRIARVV